MHTLPDLHPGLFSWEFKIKNMFTTVTFRHKATIARITGDENFIAVAQAEIVRRYAEVEEYCACDRFFSKDAEAVSCRGGCAANCA
jgi:hypothetical protein